jgi:hypothetical protein
LVSAKRFSIDASCAGVSVSATSVIAGASCCRIGSRRPRISFAHPHICSGVASATTSASARASSRAYSGSCVRRCQASASSSAVRARSDCASSNST